MKTLTLLSAIALFYAFSVPVTDGEKCLSELRQVFNTMSEHDITESKVQYLKYKVKALSNEMYNGEHISNESTFEVLNTKSKSRVYSKEMIVLRDTVNTFNIILHKKLIYWSNSFQLEQGESAYEQMKATFDSVLNHTEKVTCNLLPGGETLKELNIILDDKMSKHMQIDKLKYTIDTNGKSLKKVYIHYLPKNEFVELSYEFLEQSFDYKKEDLNTAVYDMVFDQNKQLLSKYADFKIIDSRKK